MESIRAKPYDQVCQTPKQAMPIALAMLYSVAVVLLTLLLIIVGSRSERHKETVDELKAEVVELRNMLDKEGDAIRLLNALKKQGIDPKKLVKN